MHAWGWVGVVWGTSSTFLYQWIFGSELPTYSRGLLYDMYSSEEIEEIVPQAC